MGLGSKLLEVATQLGTSSEFVYENREAWSVRRLLRRVKCDPAKLAASDVREANALERRQVNAMYDRWADEEKGGEDRLVSVVHGHPTLDPQLNPDHPFNRRARGKPQRAEPVSPGEKKMPKFVVSLKQGQRLLKELGHQHTDKLNAAAILTALKRVDDTADDAAQAKVTDPASQDLLKKLLVALAKGDDITIATAAPVEKNGSDKKQPNTKTPFPASDDEGDDDDEEAEEEDDEDADSDDEGDGEDAKPAAKKPASKPETDKPRGPVKDPPRKAPSKPQERTEKKPSPATPQKSPRSSGAKPGTVATKPKQPGTKGVSSLLDIGEEKPKKKPASKDRKPAKKGLPPAVKDGKVHVTGCVIECLKEASKTKPITMEKIVAVLKKRRKEGNVDSMLVTVRDLVRRNLKVRHNLDVRTDGKGGYWID